MEVENQNNSEFQVVGLTMEKLSIYYGIFLILWGVKMMRRVLFFLHIYITTIYISIRMLKNNYYYFFRR